MGFELLIILVLDFERPARLVLDFEWLILVLQPIKLLLEQPIAPVLDFKRPILALEQPVALALRSELP